MKKIVLILFILFTLVKIGNAQLNKPVNFPQSFIGKWKGKLQWMVAGKLTQTFTMQLNVLPTDTANQYTMPEKITDPIF